MTSSPLLPEATLPRGLCSYGVTEAQRSSKPSVLSSNLGRSTKHNKMPWYILVLLIIYVGLGLFTGFIKLIAERNWAEILSSVFAWPVYWFMNKF